MATEFKSAQDKDTTLVRYNIFHGFALSPCGTHSDDMAGWEKGVLYGEGQNLARLLMEAPANYVTPTAFADTIEEKLAPYSERVTVHKRYVHRLFT